MGGIGGGGLKSRQEGRGHPTPTREYPLTLMTDTLTLRAAYVLPHRDKVIDGGWVEIGGSRIVEVGNGLPKRDRGRVIDLGNAAVIPGLVNAHTHLELSDLQGKIPPPKSFTQWLGHILAFRRREAGKPLDHAVEKGVSLSLESGTTTVADISSTGDSLRVLPNLPIRKRVFREVICLEPEKVSGVMEGAIRDVGATRRVARTLLFPATRNSGV